jgi:hypothetical protein
LARSGTGAGVAAKPQARAKIARGWNQFPAPDLSNCQGKCRQTDMSGHAANDESHAPATLLRVMQAAVGEGLRERYEPPQKMSHQLFVLMMQMNDRARRERVQAEQEARAKAKLDKRRDALTVA